LRQPENKLAESEKEKKDVPRELAPSLRVIDREILDEISELPMIRNYGSKIDLIVREFLFFPEGSAVLTVSFI
jgi:hypothetical protein